MLARESGHTMKTVTEKLDNCGNCCREANMVRANEIEQALNCLPRKILFDYDTPTERLVRIEKELGVCPIYMKRDDLNGVGPGGNKVRPLEYLLGEAAANGCDVVLASGQENSNLCTIAAAACCRIGIRCILVHNDPPPKEHIGNVLLNRLMGIEELYIGAIPEPERDIFVAELAEKLKKEGQYPFIVENGATMPHSAVGYINILLELLRNYEKHPVSDVFVPGGNGGIAAGVVFGAALLEKPFRVHVISVEHTKQELERIIHSMLPEMESYLGCKATIGIDDVMTIYDEYRGEGWGIPAKESDGMIGYVAAQEGIFLERVYTSKTFWGMYDLLKSGRVKSKGACMIHSGGFAALDYQYR